MCDDIIEPAAVFPYLRQSIGHLLVRRLFLKPPGTSFGTIFLVEILVAPTKTPEPLTCDCVDMTSPPQMEHRWADYHNLAAVSFFARIRRFAVRIAASCGTITVWTWFDAVIVRCRRLLVCFSIVNRFFHPVPVITSSKRRRRARSCSSRVPLSDPLRRQYPVQAQVYELSTS